MTVPMTPREIVDAIDEVRYAWQNDELDSEAAMSVITRILDNDPV